MREIACHYGGISLRVQNAAMFPGCGAPCGGNMFTGGGANATATAIVATAAAISAVLSSSEKLMNFPPKV